MAVCRVLRAARLAVAAAEGAVSAAAFSLGSPVAPALAVLSDLAGVAGAGPGSRTITSPSGSSLRSTGALPALLSWASSPPEKPAPSIQPALEARRETMQRSLISLAAGSARGTLNPQVSHPPHSDARLNLASNPAITNVSCGNG